jgi:probable HAF family extracellular repeat protein
MPNLKWDNTVRLISLFVVSLNCFAADFDGNTPVNIGTFGGHSSSALGINNAGQVVGYSYLYYGASMRHAFIWDDVNGLVDLGSAGYENSIAHAINESGVVTGYTKSAGFSGEAFIWDDVNGMQLLPTMGGQIMFGLDINESNTVVGHGFNASGLMRGFVWSAIDGLTEIGTLGGTESYLYQVNDSGQAVGSAQDAGGVYRPIIWDAVNGIRQWDVEGEATSINNREQVAGVFMTPSGEAHGFVFGREFFSTDFENGLPAEVTSNSEWQIETMDSGADGSFGDHGFSSSQFLRCSQVTDLDHSVIFEFSDLEPHTSIELDVLVASIDKTVNGNIFSILIDDQFIFSETIRHNNSAWNPGAPIQLFKKYFLGYDDSNNNNGYDKGLDFGLITASDHSLGVDFSAIPHTASTLKVEFRSHHALKRYKGSTFAIDDLKLSYDFMAHRTEIDDLGGTLSLPRDINDNGTVVGLASDASEAYHAFVWDPVNDIRNLDTAIAGGTNWALNQAWAINNSNVVVGEGSELEARGWVLSP